ncbi:4'-phosphopantetheinyl transferase superfamily protein [Ethanoligenens harbinense]|nr:4'-phosphopantetheinyl transferase superfamily protein [Ethanoligenens harbinense]AVQ95022.1 hypothetical protein CXQ68_01415 [Ethanoligenens harbinense YUAN-3]AYF37715.1 hypothetical protein CXP51_01425 [Ethanoligenens harbinense]AYF40434.1 hypothetical protein CN246_01415 [Ethanoligenens harbinense]QCN91269.1 hypothetical protein DRA42_01425 [Ethanoligenens harbinense]
MEKSYEFVCISFGDVRMEQSVYQKHLHPLEQKLIEHAIDKRKAEFLSGRFCVRLAYARLCGGLSTEPCVLNDCYGAPFLTANGAYSVSITHDDGLAAALVSDKHRLRAALDVQRVSSRYTDAIYRFLRPSERELVDRHSGAYGRDFMVAAMWVAKEAMSKLFQFGFSIYDILEISDFEKGGQFAVRFARLPYFQVMLRTSRDYLFGFAAPAKQMEAFGENSLQIAPISLEHFI